MASTDQYSQYPYTPPQESPPARKTHRVRNWVVFPAVGLGGLLVAGGIVGAVAGGTHVAKNTAPPPAAPAAQASTFPTDTPASTPDDLSGPLGSTFTVSTQDNSGNDVSYDVTAVKVLDPARGADEYTTPDTGKRFAGVEFTITGDSGYSSDDANINAVIQGDDGQSYTADFSSISAGTNFNGGDFGVAAGRTQTGWVTFQLPRGVSVASVQWQPDVFGGQQPATWTP